MLKHKIRKPFSVHFHENVSKTLINLSLFISLIFIFILSILIYLAVKTLLGASFLLIFLLVLPLICTLLIFLFLIYLKEKHKKSAEYLRKKWAFKL